MWFFDVSPKAIASTLTVLAIAAQLLPLLIVEFFARWLAWTIVLAYLILG
jgi:hypothetical protein